MPQRRRDDVFVPPTTKLHAPPLPPAFLARERIHSLLDAGAGKPLTVLAAPAGAGKSAALSAWAAARPGPVAWLALDETDSERRRFWMLVLEALRRAGAGTPVTDLEVHPREPVDHVVPELLNALELLEAPVTLVLDDLHRISGSDVHTDLELLLRHPSRGLRLVVSTRFDPPVGVERMRLAGQVAELRARDLAFTLEETLELFDLLALPLAREDLEVLWRHSEGWAAGLRLAATTLHGRSDPGRLVADLAGDEANTADYLLAEVLAGESPEVREFLLRAAVVDELPVELAIELTGQQDSAGILDRLTHRHALIAPLGEGRKAYRLHTLFAELLRAQLKYERPAEVGELHERAARWFARNDLPVIALGHAVRAGHEELAAELARDCWIEALATGELGQLASLIRTLPRERIEADPELALAFAASLVESGNEPGIDRYLALASEGAERLAPERRRQFTIARATVQLYRSRARGNLKSAEEAAGRLLSIDGDLEAADQEAIRALALAGLGIVELWSASVDSGTRHLERALALATAAELDWIRLMCTAYLALGSSMSGRLAAAERRAHWALELAGRRGWGRSQAAGLALAVLAHVQFHWNHIDEAEQTMERAASVLGSSREPPTLGAFQLTRGRVLSARGRPGDALEAFEVGADRLDGWPAADGVRMMLRTEAAIVRAALGDRDAAARDLERANGESPAPAIGLAHLALADGDPARARDHLAEPLSDPRRLFPSIRVDAWTLDAIASDELANHQAAHDSLERALDEAEPAGFRRPLITYGAAIRPVLRRQLRLGTSHRALVEELLSLLDGDGSDGALRPVLAERLSDREVAVLRFLPTMMSNQEIASELFVSVNTVKTHLRAIYRKLDASDRREAVRRAREIELLAP